MIQIENLAVRAGTFALSKNGITNVVKDIFARRSRALARPLREGR